MVRFEAGKLFNALQMVGADEFSGTAHLEGDGAEEELRSLYFGFHRGRITFVGKKLPTIETLTALIKQRLNLTHIDSALKTASKRVKNEKSIRESLELISRFGLFKWKDLEMLMQSRAVCCIEQVLPYAGTLAKDSAVDFDLSYGDSGQGFEWKKLHQELAQRQEAWTALSPHISSPQAIPNIAAGDNSGMPEPLLRHLSQCVDGQRSLQQIANAIDRDPLQLAQHYLPWVKKGCIALTDSKATSLMAQPEPEPLPSPPELPIILSVDDSPIVQTMVRRAIGDVYQVLSANNAVQALNLLNTQKVALLLLDVTMPDIDGIELCRTIRGINKFRDLPVVMLTAKDGLLDKMKSQFAGSTHYLIKPIDREKLLPVVQRYVTQGRPVSFVRA